MIYLYLAVTTWIVCLLTCLGLLLRASKKQSNKQWEAFYELLRESA